MKTRSWLTNLLLLAASLSASFALAEYIYRRILFSDLPGFEALRNPNHYADFFSEDDYWKLAFRFGGQEAVPDQPHPLLGWVGDFSPDTLVHYQADQVGDRRPVLLYGDSFAACTDGVECFQDILNRDPSFAKSHYLLNYGVGGYKVDQIALLYQNSVGLYENPLVIFSLMTLDLDRSLLTVRIGQKPYYRIEDGALALKGTPIDPNPSGFYASHPPQIKSYLYRRLLFSRMVPDELAAALRGESGLIERKKELNAAILAEVASDLRARGLDHFFLIFHPHWVGVSRLDSEDDWRQLFLENLLSDLEVPYLSAKDIFAQDAGPGPDLSTYIIPGNGHPTTYFNQLIANAAREKVLGSRQGNLN